MRVHSGADPPFPGSMDASFAFGPERRWREYFGCDVLRSLMTGIDEFHAAKARERRFLVLGSALLGAFMWLDDPELVQWGGQFHPRQIQKPQVTGLISAYEKLPRHHHPLDLVGVLLDLGDMRAVCSLRG